MERRNFLSIAIKNTFLFSIFFTGKVIAKDRVHNSILDEMSSPCLIGAWYLQLHPEEKDKSFLVNHICMSLKIEKNLGFNHNSNKPYLSAAYRNDFENEDVVFIGGWLLSRTEARIYSLQYLESTLV